MNPISRFADFLWRWVLLFYGYDGANRLISEPPSQGTTYTYAYGSPTSPNLGYNLYTVVDPRGTETFLYDDLDRLTSDTKPTGEVLAHQYDARGNRLQTTLTFRSGVTNAPVVEKWTYDLSNRNITATDAAGGIKTLAYDPDSRLTQENLPNQLISTYTYDHANRLLGLVTADNTGSAVAMSNYKLDAVGNRLSRETIAENDSYTYDNTYQLTGVRTKWAQLQADTQSNPINHVASGVTMTVSVAYDPMGNRSSYQETYTGGVQALSKSYAYSPANEMLNDGGVTQTFDNNGNLTNRGGVAYTWDARNRLTGVGSGWSAVYDWNNRLATKNGTGYIYDDQGWLWSEVNAASGVPKNIYSYDAVGLIGQATLWGGSTGPLQQAYFLFDGLGSMEAVTDQSNKTIATYSTDAFGVPSSYSNYDTPFMYTGRWGGLTDSKVGVLNWNRWYLPEQSRWGSRDPIGISGGINLYDYVANNFDDKIDFSGLVAGGYNPTTFDKNIPTPLTPAEMANSACWKQFGLNLASAILPIGYISGGITAGQKILQGYSESASAAAQQAEQEALWSGATLEDAVEVASETFQLALRLSTYAGYLGVAGAGYTGWEIGQAINQLNGCESSNCGEN